MSDTWKTTPWIVRAHRAGSLRIDHDHRDGCCDLTEIPSTPHEIAEVLWCAERCYVSEKFGFLYTEKMCGCHGCTDFDGRRIDRRRSRHDARRALRQITTYSDWDSDSTPTRFVTSRR